MEKGYLVKRNNVLYFRMAVPHAFRNRVPVREIKYALKGMDLQIARTKCNLLGQRLSELFARAKHEEVIMAALHPLVKRICANILFFDGQNHLRPYGLNQYTPEECDTLIAGLQSLYRTQNTDGYIAEKFRFYAAQYGLDLDPGQRDFKTMVLDFYLGYMETLRIQKERASGNLYNGYDEATQDGRFSKILSPKDVSPELQTRDNFRAVEIMTANPAPANTFDDEPDDTAKEFGLHNFEQELAATPQAIVSPPGTAPSISLKEAIRLYLEEKQIQKKGLTPKTIREYASQLNALLEIFGDINVASIRRPQIVEVMKNVLYRYPKHRAKRYPGKPLSELLEMDIEKIDDKTQSDYFITWKSFFNWCRICEYTVLNPAEGLSADSTNPGKVSDQKKRFTVSDLDLVFRKIEELPRLKRFRASLYTHRYWIPLIALFQGMRLGEISQLFLEDFFVQEGLPCLDIAFNEEKKQRTKNFNSQRTIPIHSTLLKLGFFDYYFAVKNSPTRKNEQLFQELTYSPNGYGRKMQWFNDFAHGFIPDKRKTFHSFRHNFDTCLSNVEPNQFLIQCLDGHARKGETAQRYSVGEIHKMKKTLEKVQYGFDIFDCLNVKPLSDEKIAAQISLLPIREEV